MEIENLDVHCVQNGFSARESITLYKTVTSQN